MRFNIRRTSLWNNEKPCKEAYLIDGFTTDERTVKDPSKLNCGAKDTWYTEGLNHRVVRGYICRDFPTKLWVVDINSLEKLLKFYEKYGALILDAKSYASKDLLCLEIYDDYRE
jgi:hypothetical protein